MKIDTTINITDNNTILLKESAAKLNISINELVIRLISQLLTDKNNKIKSFQRISYQKKNENENWNPIHIWISPEFYEKCLDLRKFFKLSLSFILAKAIKQFLNRILEGITDNYSHNYILLSSISDDSRFFTTVWDYPQQETIQNIIQFHDKT